MSQGHLQGGADAEWPHRRRPVRMAPCSARRLARGRWDGGREGGGSRQCRSNAPSYRRPTPSTRTGMGHPVRGVRRRRRRHRGCGPAAAGQRPAPRHRRQGERAAHRARASARRPGEGGHPGRPCGCAPGFLEPSAGGRYRRPPHGQRPGTGHLPHRHLDERRNILRSARF